MIGDLVIAGLIGWLVGRMIWERFGDSQQAVDIIRPKKLPTERTRQDATERTQIWSIPRDLPPRMR